MNRILLVSAIAIMVFGVGTAYSQQSEIPSWIKIVAEFWADDKTSDEEFVNAIEYLISTGVIHIDDSVPYVEPNASTSSNPFLLPDASSEDSGLNQLRALANTFNEDYDSSANDYDELVNDYDELVNDYDELVVDYNALLDDYNALVGDYNKLVGDYTEQYPSVKISETEVIWEFYDSKENFYSWSMPITTYENIIEYSRDYSLQQGYDNPKHININGHSVPVLNLDGFITHSFSDVIDQIYHNSRDNPDFIYEIWYIVSLLTVYDEDVTPESEGRFSLETFTRTGGDCEDLVILVADMLMSSSYTGDWDFQYVMIDSDNLSHPQEVNHVILYINDGQYDYYIETTASPDWNYYPDGFIGWWFDVV